MPLVSSTRGLTCGLKLFCIDTVLPFQLTHSNHVSLTFLVIQVDKDEKIEKVVVETARLFMDI